MLFKFMLELDPLLLFIAYTLSEMLSIVTYNGLRT